MEKTPLGFAMKSSPSEVCKSICFEMHAFSLHLRGQIPLGTWGILHTPPGIRVPSSAHSIGTTSI